MYVIDYFIVETPDDNYPWKRGNILPLIYFCALDQILKIKVYHKVIKKHTKVIEGRRRLIYMDILGPKE